MGFNRHFHKNKYTESGLTFVFPPGWWVRRYDKHTYYQGLSGQGLKAVDFVAMSPDGYIWLIEVKNYRRRRSPAGEFVPVLKTASQLGTQLWQKTSDTLLAMRAFYAYYRRSWLFRLAEPLLLRLQWNQVDRVFWTKAWLNSSRVKVVLWLSLEPEHESFRADMSAWLVAQWPDEAPPVFLGDLAENPIDGLVVSLG